jgi:hypothetical protein
MYNHILRLDNFDVEITTGSMLAGQTFIEAYPNLKKITNPREILSTVEGIPGIESTTIREQTNGDIVISSTPFIPEE